MVARKTPSLYSPHAPAAKTVHPDLTRYRFGDFEIDPSAQQLLRDGEPVPVQGLVFDLLLFLVRHPGEVLSKERLLAEVWDNQHLTDATIAQAVRKARAALGDDGRAQAFIRTVHGRGVRFEAAVDVIEVSSSPARTSAHPVPPPAGQHKIYWAAAIVLMAAMGVGLGAWRLSAAPESSTAGMAVSESPAVSPVRVAVFPFDNATGESDFDWFQTGLATATRDLIGQSANVEVLGPAELDEVPDGELSRRAGFVGAAHGLQASVSRVDGQFVVGWTLAQPTMASTEGRFEAADATLIARELARVVLEAIDGRLPTRVPRELDLGDPLAVELYSRGLEASMHDDRRQAVALLDAAQARAPDSIPLKVAAARVAFDPADVGASVQRFRGLLDALPVSARDARVRLQFEVGNLLWYAGEVDQAASLLAAALVESGIDPLLRARILNSLAFAEQSQLHYDAAWEHAREAEVLLREQQRPYFLSMALTNLGYLAEDMGRIAEAGRYHEEAMQIREQHGFPSLIAASRYGIARILRRSGRFEEAAVQLERALETAVELELLHDVFDNYEELAEVRMRQASFDLAAQMLDSAREVAHGNDDALGLAWERQVRGRLVLRQGKAGVNSIAAHEAVIRDFEAMGERQDALRARLELAQLLLAVGDVGAAGRPLEVVLNSGEGFRNNPVLKLEYDLIDAQRQALSGQAEPALAGMLGVVRRARGIGVLDIEAEAAIVAGTLALELGDMATAGRMLGVARAWSPGYYRTVALADALQAAEAVATH